MPIAQLGYRHWQGLRTGSLRRCLAITKSELAIALKSSKLLRRFLILAWMPILYFCPIFLGIGYVANPDNELREGSMLAEIARELLPKAAIDQLRDNPEIILPGLWALGFYFFFAYTQSFLSMIVVAIVGPPLIAKDLRSKAFLVYFSKPIRPWQYLLGKLLTVLFFVFSMTLFPALLLSIVGIALSPSLSTVVATIPILLEIAAASAIIAIPISLLVLLLSSLTKNRRLATFAWLALWIVGEISFRTLSIGGSFGSNHEAPGWAALLSIRELTTQATSAIFGVRGHLTALLEQLGPAGGRLERSLRDIARDMGDSNLLGELGQHRHAIEHTSSAYPPTVSIIVLILASIVCCIILLRRVTKPVRI